MTDAQQQPAWKFWLSILFCFLQVVLGLLALGYLMLRGFDCADRCVAAGVGYTIYGFAICGFAVALASIVLLFLLNKRTWAWMIPGVAILVIIFGFIITNGAIGALLPKGSSWTALAFRLSSHPHSLNTCAADSQWMPRPTS